MKDWKTYQFDVNGFEVDAVYNRETVEQIFVPLLERAAQMCRESGGRIILFMAAPPAVGKSTLTEFLSFLSLQRADLIPVQAIGMDGFHYHSEYLKNHFLERDGRKILMSAVKGCPETFDVQRLRNKLTALREGDVMWPYYDRTIHDVREEQIAVTGEIVLLEGNYLLLDEDNWRDLQEFVDYTILIQATEEQLRERLISRKMRGGLDRAEAEKFYRESDGVNVARVVHGSMRGDLNLKLTDDGDFQEFM